MFAQALYDVGVISEGMVDWSRLHRMRAVTLGQERPPQIPHVSYGSYSTRPVGRLTILKLWMTQ